MANERSIRARLRPYQSEFVRDFINGSLGQHVLLVHHVGMGASYAAVEAVREHVIAEPNARVLVLVASAMLEQWHFQLIEAGVPHDLVDRYRYRELQDSLFEETSIWSRSEVVLMRPRFDQYTDMLSSLDQGQWTMVVAVDSHRLMREGSELLLRIGHSSPTAKMLLLSPFYYANALYHRLEPLNVVRWNWGRIAEQSGTERREPIRLETELVRFELERMEIAMRKEVESLKQYSAKSRWRMLVPEGQLMHALASSPAAFEETLRRYRNRLSHGTPFLRERTQDVSQEGMTIVEDRSREEWLKAANVCLEASDFLFVDSKWDAFERTVKAFHEREDSASVYVVTEFRATMLYLQSRLEELGIGSISYQGSSTAASLRDTSLFGHQRSGYYLATNAMLNERLDLSFIDKVVFYDPPRNEMVLHRVLSQLGDVRRSKPLSMDIVLDSSDERAELRTLKYIEVVAQHWGFALTVGGQPRFSLFS